MVSDAVTKFYSEVTFSDFGSDFGAAFEDPAARLLSTGLFSATGGGVTATGFGCGACAGNGGGVVVATGLSAAGVV